MIFLRNILKWIKYNWILLPLLRLVYKVELFTVKRAIKLRALLRAQLSMRIRLSIKESQQEGANTELDKCIEIVTWHLVAPEFFNEDLKKYLLSSPSDRHVEFIANITKESEQHKEMVEKILEDVSILAFKDALILKHMLVQSFIYSKFHSDESKLASEKYMELAKEIDVTAEKWLPTNVEREIKNSKKENSIIRILLEDRDAIKFTLTLVDAVRYITIISAGIVVSGFLYSHYIYSHFGFSMNDYFSISDYHSSSIEGLYPAFWGFFIAAIAVLIGAHHGSRKSVQQIKYENKKPNYFGFLMWLLIPSMLYLGYIGDDKNYNQSISFSVVIGSYLVVPIIAQKYFRNYFFSMIVMVILVNWGAKVYWSAADEIINMEERISSERSCDNFYFSPSVKNDLDPCELSLIGANSSYVFFVSRDRKNSYAIRAANVTIVRNDTPTKEPRMLNVVVNKVLKGVNWAIGVEVNSPASSGSMPKPNKHKKEPQ